MPLVGGSGAQFGASPLYNFHSGWSPSVGGVFLIGPVLFLAGEVWPIPVLQVLGRCQL